MNRIIYNTILILLLATTAQADHNLHLFEQARQMYEQGNYTEAAQQYEEIITTGYASWEVYYNLGNCYYKLQNIGKSILNYERALQLANDQEDILFNMELAKLLVVDKIVEPPAFLPFQILSALKNMFGLNSLSVITIVLYIMLMLIVSLLIIVRKRGLIKLTRVILPVVLVGFLFFSTLLGLRIYEEVHVHQGIILADEIIVRSSPESSATELFSLHEGTKVQVQKENGNWCQIRLRDGKVGWLKQEAVEKI